MTTVKPYRKYRTTRGQALVEGTANMLLLGLLIVGGTLLLAGSGIYMIYKMKIAAAAAAAAQAGMDAAYWGGAARPGFPKDVQATVENVAQSCLTSSGITGGVSVAPVVIDTIGDNRYITVTVQVDGLQMISGGILPSVFPAISETAAYAYGNQNPPAMAHIDVQHYGFAFPYGQGGLWLPCYIGHKLAPVADSNPYSGTPPCRAHEYQVYAVGCYVDKGNQTFPAAIPTSPLPSR